MYFFFFVKNSAISIELMAQNCTINGKSINNFYIRLQHHLMLTLIQDVLSILNQYSIYTYESLYITYST